MLESMLGRGGMGEVWRAVDTSQDDRVVALKVLGSWLAGDGDFYRRFRRESALAAKLTGPHIVPIHRYGEIDGRLFIDMALIDGTDLGALLERGALPPQRALTIVDHIADALDTAHDAGLVHRDIKPTNVLVTSRKNRDHAYLIDFGIAHAVDGTKISLSGAVIGTPKYMAPERFDGDGDHRSDVYALGCVLYETLTGQPPFDCPSLLAYLKAHHTAPPPLLSAQRPDLPAALDDVIARAMAKAPTDRYPTAGELAAAAHAALAARPWRATGTITVPVAQDPDPVRADAPPPALEAPPEPDDPAVPAQSPSATTTERIPLDIERAIGERRGSTPSRYLIGAAALAAVAVAAVLVINPWRPAPSPGPQNTPDSTTTMPQAAPPAAVAPAAPAVIDMLPLPNDVGTRRLAFDARGERLFIAQNADVDTSGISVVDVRTKAITAIPTPASEVVPAPDGSRAYALCLEAGCRTINVIDTASGTVIKTITLDRAFRDAAMSAQGDRLYVAYLNSEVVAVIDTASGTVTATLRAGDDERISSGPNDVAVTPDGRYVYVARSHTGQIAVVDSSTNAVVATIPLAEDPAYRLTTSPDGRSIYAAGTRGTYMIDVASNTLVTTFLKTDTSFAPPAAIAASPDGRRLYLLHGGSEKSFLRIVDTESGAHLADVDLPGLPGASDVTVSPDGTRAYVGSWTATSVTVIDTGVR
ncbi:protein kinase domain-containing protein [Pseudonocardia sp. TRM90224]|uniref:protein kinase domain-containing protein n=1 Tax=Pseudonocardia sp. TRM90224 TaxID=2812678 RepID=UPI001E2BB21A|nr:protein kinase [Pseudonocardia sp. TRM90224]